VPIDLVELLTPSHTAMLTMEMQRGVVGDLSVVPELAVEVAAQGVIASAARLAAAARLTGARVVHCTAEFRTDRAGSAANAPMLAALLRNPRHLEVGSRPAEVVPELGPDPSDLVSSRRHGISPFTGTDLDAVLRNLGVRTVVATGVSVNLGVLGLAIEAVNLGYRVAVVTDAVAGVPRDYAEAVMKNTLALLATRVTVDDVIAAWGV
jgi:nicotinamidase-related amidase